MKRAALFLVMALPMAGCAGMFGPTEADIAAARDLGLSGGDCVAAYAHERPPMVQFRACSDGANEVIRAKVVPRPEPLPDHLYDDGRAFGRALEDVTFCHGLYDNAWEASRCVEDLIDTR